MKSLSGFVSQHAPFLRWWLMFTGLCVGAFFAYNNGLIQRFFEVDVTNISLIIMSVFMFFTLLTGFDTFRASKVKDIKNICKRVKVGWFFSDALITLGLLGTVSGFIIMLGGDINVTKEALSTVKSGMGIALYTTAAGVTLSLLLKLQLFNLNICIDELEESNNSCSCKG